MKIYKITKDETTGKYWYGPLGFESFLEARRFMVQRNRINEYHRAERQFKRDMARVKSKRQGA